MSESGNQMRAIVQDWAWVTRLSLWRSHMNHVEIERVCYTCISGLTTWWFEDSPASIYIDRLADKATQDHSAQYWCSTTWLKPTGVIKNLKYFPVQEKIRLQWWLQLVQKHKQGLLGCFAPLLLSCVFLFPSFYIFKTKMYDGQRWL